jgi:rhodanese-related sulfurtransferase
VRFEQYYLDCLSQASSSSATRERAGRWSSIPGGPTVVYCASGYRSSIAASELAAAGFDDVSDLLGGFEAWKVQHRSGRANESRGGEKEPHA